MDINKYETMPVRQPISAEGLREREYDYNEQDPQALAAQASTPWIILERFLLVVSLLTGAISHGYHLFIYPLYITDEDIYMQQTCQCCGRDSSPPTPTFMTTRPQADCL